jgi:pimeloyl-ACP methyl ester carboxylesterase
MLLNAEDAGVGVAAFAHVGNGTDIGLEEASAHLLERPEIRTLALLIEGLHDPAAFVALARQARAPGLVVRGALDPLCAADEARQVAEALGERGGLEVTLPEAGHFPALQQPERFHQALEGLLMTAEANMLTAN